MQFIADPGAISRLHAVDWFLQVDLKIRHMALLIALDQHRNMLAAARSVGATPSVASRQLKAIETALGVSLFERLPSGMIPTSYGAVLIRRSRMIVASLSRACGEIERIRSGLTGSVGVGGVLAAAMNVLPRAIARVKACAPRLGIRVRVESSDRLFDRLQRGTLDFIVGRIPDDGDSAAFVVEPLAEEPVCIAVRPGHPALECDAADLARLARWPWIVPPRGSVLRKRFDAMFRQAGLEPPLDVIETGAPLVATPLLQLTGALYVLPVQVAKHFEAQGLARILPIGSPLAIEPYGIVRWRDRMLSPGAALLLDEVKAAAREFSGTCD